MARLARPLGRLGLAVFVVIVLVALMLALATSSFTLETALQFVGFAAFAIVGAILLEQAAHPIGWICLAIGLGGATTGLAQGYVLFAETQPETGGVELAALVEVFIGFPATALVFTFLPLLFPDGHLPSPRWRVVAWLAIVDIAVFVIAFGLTPTSLFSSRPNPIAIVPAGPATDLLNSVVGILTIATGTLCASALLVRYRHADGVVRQQLKWVVAAVAVFAIALVVSILLPPIDTFALTLPLLPVAVGVAVLRYRLYDIDVLISRALVYVPLTALLGGLYAASVALFQRIFVAITGDRSDAAIVITTLILAAVFTPARKALEGVVDRRFRPLVSPGQPGAAQALVALDDPEVERRIAAIARAVVDEALADRARIEKAEKGRKVRGD
jgi:hypothetical protein